jgi:outer membrane receptor protein involved in Fe transport
VPRESFSIILCAFTALTMPPPARADDTPVPTVTVAAKKEAVVRKIDRTVHDVANVPRAANGSAQDVLQSTPELAVTADGRIAVKGNAQVTVLVDGKPNAMLSGSGEERAVALQTMSGADIASVEVITNPSAAYDANGGAIVNIVLKRSRKPGVHAQLQGSAADHGLSNLGWSGDATRGAISVHGNLALRHDGTLKERRAETDWFAPDGDPAGHALQTSTVFVRRVVESAGVGIDAALGGNDTVSLSARRNARRSHPPFDTLNELRTGDTATVYHRISDGPNEQADDSASLAFSHSGIGSALKATLQRSTTTALVDKSYRDVFLAPARATGYSHGATRSTRRLDGATVDWTRTLAGSQWGVGVDVQDRTDAIGNYQASIDPATRTETPDPNTTNAYAVRTLRAAAYLTGQVTRGKWELLLGGRAEDTTLRVRPGSGTGRWRAFNPSLHLKYALMDAADLTLGYRRSLQMPDPRDLDPFTTYVDAQNRSRGNPGLQPQRLAAWEAGVHAHGSHLDGGFTTFYRGSSATVFDARSVAGGVLVTTKQNGGYARSAGVTGTLDWTPGAALRLGADGGVYRVLLGTPDLGGTVRQGGAAGYVNVRAGCRAGPDEVALDAHRQSAGITPLGRHGATSSVNLTWKRTLTPTLSLTVNASDVFDGSRRTYAFDGAMLRQAGSDHFVARRVYVGFVKKIG